MKIAVSILLLFTTSDALRLSTAVSHRHASPSSSSVAMGLFDGLKKAPPSTGTAFSSAAITSSTAARSDRYQQCLRHQ